VSVTAMVVGGKPAGRARLLAFSLTVGAGAAFSGAVYSGSCTPTPVEPPVVPTAPPTMPPMPPDSGPPPGPEDAGTEPPKPPSCVFEVPRVERAERPLPASRIVGGTPALPDEA